MTKPDITTITKVASVASKILRNKNYSKAVKSAAGSALFQRKVLKEGVLSKAEKAASKTLRNSYYSKSAKKLTGSAFYRVRRQRLINRRGATN
ncbi:MAG: hypothetical protein B6I26_02580 [Desulfobacteraceae bacterium 4572_130]|nr:MAG: hypothetical protein B6I26_02580 [Desulfobacteraceae bacterium 4572_130]